MGDFVNKYATSNAREDFAETTRFLLEHQFPIRAEPLPPGPLAPALRAKFEATAEALGNLDLLKKIPGY